MNQPKRGRPPTGNTPRRAIRISDQQWELFAEAAKRLGTDRTKLIIEAAVAKARRVLK